MIHYTSPRFWDCYARLPQDIRLQARRNYRLLLQDPNHPSLRFKKLKGRDLWSARISKDYRAVAMPVEGGLQWFWIGTHADYDRLIR